MRTASRLVQLTIALLPAANAAADPIWVHPVQTSFIARCDFCTAAEVNVANPLVVLAPGSVETVGLLAFDLPTRPEGQVLSSAVLSVTPTTDSDFTNTWIPLVTVNSTQGDVDLGSLLGHDLPEPESAPASFLATGGPDQWDLTGDLASLLGQGVLVLLNAPPGAVSEGPRYQCEGLHPGARQADLPVLTLEFEPGTPLRAASISRSKTSFTEPE